MSEVAGLCRAIFGGTVWVARNVWQLMDSIFTFNYRLVTTIIQVVSKIYLSLCVLYTSVFHAFCEVFCYMGQGIALLLTLPLHFCTFIFQLICSASSVVTEIIIFFIKGLVHIASLFHSWITGSLSVQQLLEGLLSSCLCGWKFCISSTAHFLQSLRLLVDMVLGASTSAVDSAIGSLVTSVCETFHCSKLIAAVSNSLSAVWDYATPGAILCTFCLSLIVSVLLWQFGYRIRSESLEVMIYDFDDIEVSDEEPNMFEITPDDSDVILVNDDEDQSLEALVTDQSESDEDEDLSDDQGSEAGYLSSTDSNRDTDGDDDSDESDAISIQLPERSTLNCHASMDARTTNNTVNSNLTLAENERSLCVICQDQVKSVLVLPCRHLCMCVECAHTIVSGIAGRRRTCPLCRSSIRTIMNIYT